MGGSTFRLTECGLLGGREGRARVLARREDVADLATYLSYQPQSHAELSEKRIAGTRSLPAHSS